MAQGKRSNGGSSSGGGGARGPGKKQSVCSFCGKSQRDAGPMVEGPKDVYICKSCVELCHNIIRQEMKRTSTRALVANIPTPRPTGAELSTGQ